MLLEISKKELLMLKVYGYTRISVDLQEDFQENTSIENQKKIIRDFVKAEFPDAELTIFEDRDRSGYTFAQRESYQIMRADLMSGECKILVVKDFSRFSRRNSLGLWELETLRDAGVRIISIGDHIDYPTRDDWMLIQFKFLLNEMPVTDTSKKIKQIINSRQKSGQWICAVPYGYRMINTKEMIYQIDPPAAEIVREIFRLYNNGWGYKRIANHLTECGIPTPRANEIAAKEAEGKPTKITAKNEWSIITVQTILKNDFYIGTLRQKKYTRKGINGKNVKIGDEDQVVIENAHEAIIDIRTFTYAQDQLKIRTKTNFRGEKKYAADYSGFLFCGDCGSPMFSMSRADLAPSYTCGTYHRRGLKGCTSHHIRVDVLDSMLKEYIKRVRDNCSSMVEELQKMIDDQPKREEELGNTIEKIQEQLDRARSELKSLYKERVLIGTSDDARARTKLSVFDELEEELVDRIERLEKQFEASNDLRNSIIQTNRKAKTVIEVFDDIISKEKLDKRDIGIIVERITVYEGHIEIMLKSDIDELLSIDTSESGTENAVNFNSGSRDITITQKSGKHTDKVFTANVICNGDPLEIFTDSDGEVIFKKYSPIGELNSLTSQYADVLFRGTGLPVIVTDRDSVIACAGISKKEVMDRRVSQSLESLMERHENYICAVDSERIRPVEGLDKDAAVAFSIVGGGDVSGAVVMLMHENGSCPTQTETKLAQIAASFLGKQMEE